MVWRFIGVYIMSRTLHGRLEIRNFSSHVEKNISLIRCAHAIVKYFSTLEEKFCISPHGHVIAELWRAKRACGASWVSKSTHRRKCANQVTVHRPQPARPSVRTTGKPMFKTDIAHIVFRASRMVSLSNYCI